MKITKISPIAACMVLLALGTPASAHRLDEYLQATTISVAQDKVQAQMRLTPGVAVFRKVFASMDANGDGVLSEAERRAYAERVLGALSLTMDNKRLPLRLVSWKFASVAEMKAGSGEIELAFTAEVPRSAAARILLFENHHQSKIAVYMVNCLVPDDPNIQVTAQRRNYQQSRYELDYTQATPTSSGLSAAGKSIAPGWFGAAALLALPPFVWLWRRGVRTGRTIMPTRTKMASLEEGSV